MIIFLAFVGLMLYITKEAFTNSDIDALISPVDDDMKLCGIDYPDYGYLYYAIQPKIAV
jgi:hypothetical protein